MRNMLLCFSLFLMLVAARAQNNIASWKKAKDSQKSQWAYLDATGKLTYKTLPRGDRIIDFSYAGYMGGGTAIPFPAAKVTLSPTEGDNSAAIQNAINEVSKLQPVNGFKGAVLLKPGIYNCENTININQSGIVLRGSGRGETGTIINMTGKLHACISVRGNIVSTPVSKPTTFADAYVPSGSMSFTVVDASGFKTGDTIRIIRPVTEAWVKFMGMDTMPPGAANWVIGSSGEKQKRAIPFKPEPFLPEGIYDSHDVRVTPASLYLSQLAERLGKNAVKNIGY